LVERIIEPLRPGAVVRGPHVIHHTPDLVLVIKLLLVQPWNLISYTFLIIGYCLIATFLVIPALMKLIYLRWGGSGKWFGPLKSILWVQHMIDAQFVEVVRLDSLVFFGWKLWRIVWGVFETVVLRLQLFCRWFGLLILV
jgi:hypothetical protein